MVKGKTFGSVVAYLEARRMGAMKNHETAVTEAKVKRMAAEQLDEEARIHKEQADELAAAIRLLDGSFDRAEG